MPDPQTIGMVLISIGVLLTAALWILIRRREKGAKRPPVRKEAQASLPYPPAEKEGRLPLERPPAQAGPAESADKEGAAAPAFEILPAGPRLWGDLLRALIVILRVAAAAGLALVFLPQRSIDGIAERLRARHGAAQPEKIAFLYLGDELSGDVFRIRGAVRNIAPTPIEQLDASIRLYAPDRTVLETVVVRMDKEVIAPGEVARFELVYPVYKMEFGSYSVEFKLRQGPRVPYRDMRKRREDSG
jgi:hypothetical protein